MGFNSGFKGLMMTDTTWRGTNYNRKITITKLSTLLNSVTLLTYSATQRQTMQLCFRKPEFISLIVPRS